MCAICGELRFDGAPPDMRAVERMSGKLDRRGPDRGGTFADGPHDVVMVYNPLCAKETQGREAASPIHQRLDQFAHANERVTGHEHRLRKAFGGAVGQSTV